MRKVYCDFCGNSDGDVTKVNFQEPIYDHLLGSYDILTAKILKLIFENFDVCFNCQNYFKQRVVKIKEELESEKSKKES